MTKFDFMGTLLTQRMTTLMNFGSTIGNIVA